MLKNSLDELNKLLNKSEFLKSMQISFVFVSLKLDFIIAKMPIKKKFFHPFGYLHGGILIFFSETIGCSLSLLNINKKLFNVFNIDISSNHLRFIKDTDIISAEARIIHKGKNSHFIHINILNKKKKLVHFSKMTNLIKRKQ